MTLKSGAQEVKIFWQVTMITLEWFDVEWPNLAR